MKKTHEELERLYQQSESCDHEHFAEQRSNIRLVSSDHYKRVSDRLSRGFRNTKNQSKKLRLVKNHCQVIMKQMTNTMLQMAPGVTPTPFNESEPQDVKAAQLNLAVWNDAKVRQNLDAKTDEWADQFNIIGEIASKIFWDPNKGKLIGYEQATDDDGNPIYTDMNGADTLDQCDPMTGMPCEPKSSGTPVYEGELCIEIIPCYNLLRDPTSEDMQSSPYLCYRKMVDIDVMKKMVHDDEELVKKLQKDAKQTFKVFDSNSGGYNDTANEVMIKEYFFRPSPDCPNGYFYITTSSGILFEGELPLAEEIGEEAFPIVYEGNEKYPTQCRQKAHLRHLRPYQAEINRAASSIATTQITLGDDKLIVKKGSMVSKGHSLPGIRTVEVSGPDPKILAGRSGEQYLGYLNNQIDEMYRVSPWIRDYEDMKGSEDLMASLFKRMSQKHKSKRAVKKFERFQVRTCRKYLAFAKRYLPDNYLVKAVGPMEMVNIPEFRDTSDEGFDVKIVPSNEDMDTMWGKYLVTMQSLQYSQDVSPDVKIKMLKDLPFLDSKRVFSNVVSDEDIAENMLLAMDRGEQFQPSRYDEPAFMIKALMSRMRKPDFAYLDPQIQQNYDMVMQQFQQIDAKQKEDLLRAQKGFIPTDGPLVTVDYYVEEPNSEGGIKTVRAKLPTNSIEWLIGQMKEQGLEQDRLMEMDNQPVMAEMMNELFPPNQQPGMAPPMNQGAMPTQGVI